MLRAIEAYLALRRATGFAMLNAEYLLKSFAAFATERGQTHVRTQTAIDWAARGPSVAQRDARLKVVCRFVRYVRVEDDRHELPPAKHFGARKTRRPPHIYSAAEIDHLIEAALQLRPTGGLRSQTYATLIALLSVTGLRISEALKLTIADVTGDGLLIRETKFRKTRLVPLHDTAEAGLKRYLARRRPGSKGDPVFVDARGLPLRYIAVKETFDTLVVRAGIVPATKRRPRLHDLRHTFAVARCRPVRRIEAGRARIWWRLRPTWATSTSTRPIGTWKPPPTSCATSPWPVKGSSPKGGNHDADCSPHRSVPR
jgi:integrase